MEETTAENPPRKGLKKGLYLIPTAFTAANAGMGFLAVMWSMKGFQLVGQNNFTGAALQFKYAATAIGFAILFDTLDGRVARMTKTTTEIGVQLDSISDVLTFGIAPASLIYGWAMGSVFPEQSSWHDFSLFILFMFMMCGAFRLARFNVLSTRPHVIAEGAPKVDKKNFVGLPIPPAAGLLASIVLFTPMPLIAYGDAARNYALLVLLLMCFLGFLMVSTIKYNSFKSVGTGKLGLRTAVLIIAAVMSVWFFARYVLLLLAIVYVSHGFVFYIASLLRPRRKLEA